jgi:recombination associated protein RdgC
MSTNPFKSFIPYFISHENAPDDISDIACVARDPSGGQWSASGITIPFRGETDYVIDLQGTGRLMVVQFNERILPGKVRDEVLSKKVVKLEEDTGRPVSKKEYAAMRDEVEFDLLPKAFIRRSRVPVLFFNMALADGQKRLTMLICTSGARRADECIGVLHAFFGEGWQVNPIQTTNSVRGSLTRIAFDGSYNDDGFKFEVGMSALLKGEEKRTIRVKDKSLLDSDVRQFLHEGYEAFELGLDYFDQLAGSSEDPSVQCSITEKMVFKGVKLPGVKINDAKKDQHGAACIIVGTYKKMLADFIAACDGVLDPDDEL